MNNSEEFIMKYFHDQEKEYTLVGWGTTVSCYGIGGLIGSIVGPKVIGRYVGRKATLLINNIFLVLSSYLIAFAPSWWWQAIGRIFVGIVAGIATAVVPTYLSEISPIAIRGAISTMHQLGITVGILVSQALSTPSLNLLGSEEKWKWLFLVPVLCGLFEVAILPFCPESPSYLYVTQGESAARKALVRLQSEAVADEYMSYIRQEVEATEEGTKSISVYELFTNRSLRKQLIVGVTIQLMMQFSGIDAVFYYSTTVFRHADVSDPELATTCLGVINVLVTIVAVKYMDSAGRKTLLQYSWIGMCASYLILTLSFIFKPALDFMNEISVLATTGVIVCFAFGPGCIAWFIIAEIFPLSARDTAMAIGIFVNWIANWLVGFSFPILLEYTQPYTFLLFVATTAFFLYFTNNFVPETKGLTISEVTHKFNLLELDLC
jgi:sugar porter (SP) family MFS transporter